MIGEALVVATPRRAILRCFGPTRAAWFHDPDGNTFGLRQG